jgi:hypothetical protein
MRVHGATVTPARYSGKCDTPLSLTMRKAPARAPGSTYGLTAASSARFPTPGPFTSVAGERGTPRGNAHVSPNQPADYLGLGVYHGAHVGGVTQRGFAVAKYPTTGAPFIGGNRAGERVPKVTPEYAASFAGAGKCHGSTVTR